MNVSASRMPVLDVITDNMRYEQGINDMYNTQKCKMTLQLFAAMCYKNVKNRNIFFEIGYVFSPHPTI